MHHKRAERNHTKPIRRIVLIGKCIYGKVKGSQTAKHTLTSSRPPHGGVTKRSPGQKLRKSTFSEHTGPSLGASFYLLFFLPYKYCLPFINSITLILRGWSVSGHSWLLIPVEQQFSPWMQQEKERKGDGMPVCFPEAFAVLVFVFPESKLHCLHMGFIRCTPKICLCL